MFPFCLLANANRADPATFATSKSGEQPRGDAFKKGRNSMATGKLKWWDNKKGFGFITQDDGQDVFVHHTSIPGSGFKTLTEGETLIFDVIPSEKGPKAQNVRRAEDASPA